MKNNDEKTSITSNEESNGINNDKGEMNNKTIKYPGIYTLGILLVMLIEFITVSAFGLLIIFALRPSGIIITSEQYHHDTILMQIYYEPAVLHRLSIDLTSIEKFEESHTHGTCFRSLCDLFHDYHEITGDNRDVVKEFLEKYENIHDKVEEVKDWYPVMYGEKYCTIPTFLFSRTILPLAQTVT
jgi:hypothetical protein